MLVTVNRLGVIYAIFVAFSECGKREGLMMPFRCRKENQQMQECLVRW